jgi:hypothetical protein
MSDCGADNMVVSNPNSPKVKLTGGQKWLIAGLFFLQIPSGAIFYPLATIIVLTGVGAPLSIILLRIGTMPYSLAMKRKAAWQSGEERDTEHGQDPKVIVGD